MLDSIRTFTGRRTCLDSINNAVAAWLARANSPLWPFGRAELAGPLWQNLGNDRPDEISEMERLGRFFETYSVRRMAVPELASSQDSRDQPAVNLSIENLFGVGGKCEPLISPGRPAAVIAGAGEGKTLLCAELWYRLWTQSRKDETCPVPVMLDMKELVKIQNLSGGSDGLKRLASAFSHVGPNNPEWVSGFPFRLTPNLVFLVDGVDEVDLSKLRDWLVKSRSILRSGEAFANHRWLFFCRESRLRSVGDFDAKMLFQQGADCGLFHTLLRLQPIQPLAAKRFLALVLEGSAENEQVMQMLQSADLGPVLENGLLLQLLMLELATVRRPNEWPPSAFEVARKLKRPINRGILIDTALTRLVRRQHDDDQPRDRRTFKTILHTIEDKYGVECLPEARELTRWEIYLMGIVAASMNQLGPDVTAFSLEVIAECLTAFLTCSPMNVRFPSFWPRISEDLSDDFILGQNKAGQPQKSTIKKIAQGLSRSPLLGARESNSFFWIHANVGDWVASRALEPAVRLSRNVTGNIDRIITTEQQREVALGRDRWAVFDFLTDLMDAETLSNLTDRLWERRNEPLATARLAKCLNNLLTCEGVKKETALLRLSAVYTDYGYLQRRLTENGLAELLADSERSLGLIAETGMFLESRTAHGTPQDSLAADHLQAIRLIVGALSLSAPQLKSSLDNLPSQLWGRLCESSNRAIQDFLRNLVKQRHSPWLMLKNQSLTTPDSALLKRFVHPDTQITAMQRIDDDRIILGLENGCLEIWDFMFSRKIDEWQADETAIRSIVVASDGKRIAAVSLNKVILLNLGNRTLVPLGTSEKYFSHSIAFSASGTFLVLAALCEKATHIKAWNAQTAERILFNEHSNAIELDTIQYPLMIGISDCANRIYAWGSTERSPRPDGYDLQIIDVAMKYIISSIKSIIGLCEFSWKGRQYLAGCMQVDSSHGPFVELIVVDIITGAIERRSSEAWGDAACTIHFGWYPEVGIFWRAKESSLYCFLGSRGLYVWNLDGSVINQTENWRLRSYGHLLESGEHFISIPNGHTFWVIDLKTRHIRYPNNRYSNAADLPRARLSGHAISHTLEILTLLAEGVVNVFSTNNTQEEVGLQFPAMPKSIISLKSHVLIMGRNGITLYDPRNPGETKSVRGSFQISGKNMISKRYAGVSVYSQDDICGLIEMKHPKPLFTIDLPDSRLPDVYSPCCIVDDQGRLAIRSCSDPRNISLYSLETGRKVDELSFHGGKILRLECIQSSPSLFFSSAEDGSIALWESGIHHPCLVITSVQRSSADIFAIDEKKNLIFTVSLDGRLSIWNYASLEQEFFSDKPLSESTHFRIRVNLDRSEVWILSRSDFFQYDVSIPSKPKILWQIRRMSSWNAKKEQLTQSPVFPEVCFDGCKGHPAALTCGVRDLAPSSNEDIAITFDNGAVVWFAGSRHFPIARFAGDGHIAKCAFVGEKDLLSIEENGRMHHLGLKT